MVQIEGGRPAEPSRHVRAAQQASRAGQLAEQARRQAHETQQLVAERLDSAVISLANSADSQDRTAKVVEDAAEHSARSREKFREFAARHRKYAQDDRRMAQELRQIGQKWLDAQAGPGPSHRP